jgi:hypothetical protein
MAKLTGIELKRARLVPSSVFADPGAVVRSEALNRAQKIEILRRWEFDALRGGSGMASVAADPDSMLDQIRSALMTLGVRLPPRSISPTRH